MSHSVRIQRQQQRLVTELVISRRPSKLSVNINKQQQWLLINSELRALALASPREPMMTSLTSRVSIQSGNWNTSTTTTVSIHARPFDVQEDISPTQHSLLEETCRLQLLTQESCFPTSQDQHAAGLSHHLAQHQDQSRDKHCRHESCLDRQLRELKIKEGSHATDAPSVPAIDNKNWPKTMDSFQDHFSSVLGETKAPLACIIRDEAIVGPEADDPPDNHDTPENKTIARVPHQDAAGVNLPTCVHDRSAVWQAISEATRDDKCWTYVKPFQRSRDGRGAHQPLHTHCLGANHVNNVASVAEAKLAQAKYYESHASRIHRC
jgi:hypothetical protein